VARCDSRDLVDCRGDGLDVRVGTKLAGTVRRPGRVDPGPVWSDQENRRRPLTQGRVVVAAHDDPAAAFVREELDDALMDLFVMPPAQQDEIADVRRAMRPRDDVVRLAFRLQPGTTQPL